MTKLDINKDVLLFYTKHKYDFPDHGSLRSVSGFYSWYLRLVKALRRAGYSIFENDYDLAMKNPAYPVGLVGTPVAIEKWDLANPAILGPSMYDHPMLNPTLMEKESFKYYLFTCSWLLDVFKPFYGDKVSLWYAGIETDEWPDMKDERKEYDILIYDKMRWTRSVKEEHLLKPILKYLEAKQLSYHILEYGNISHEQYKDLLKKSRAMIFLCEHETQGMAYQEAMSCNLPILAWDPGYWVDALWEIYAKEPVPATSVPYFSEKCGLTFQKIQDFASTFDRWWSNIDKYEPRNFVRGNISLESSADIYMKLYKQINKAQ